MNRNIALLASDADIILFADDDIAYYDGTLAGVQEAFRHWPDADVIIFSIEYEKEGQICMKKYVPQKRMRIWNSLKYGACAIGARRASLLEKNITFHQKFGGGCDFGCGEDSLFLKECFDKKLKVYTYHYVLGRSDKNSSSWFTGFNEKFYYDKGAMLSQVFPKMKFLMLPVFAARLKGSNLTYFQRLRWMLKGSKNVKSWIPYEQAEK